MVLFAIMLIVLLAFVGIAVDVGFGFVRSSQFSAAVDAAALAGVIDLNPNSETDTDAADTRAWQFLAANGWPMDTLNVFESGRSYTDRGIPQYTITVTWPVDLFFLSLLGIESYEISHSATAAYFAQSEIYTASAFERGHVRKTSLFAFGPDSCTFAGDPVSSLHATAPGVPNEDYALANGVYRFRFRVPHDYAHDRVRVELFDTDSVNANTNNSVAVQFSDSYAATGGTGDIFTCTGESAQPGQRCVLRTPENLEAVFHNPFWFVRMDETWDGTCASQPGNPTGNTTTDFELYYYSEQGLRIVLARYEERNHSLGLTDMNWISPGAPGSPVPATVGSFEVDLAPIPPGLGNARYIYMDVKTDSGNSKNVFDVRAGLPTDELPADWISSNNVNTRNLYLANNPTFDPSGAVQTFALGRMALQHYYQVDELLLPLVPVDTLMVNGVIYATLFDYDSSDPPPIIEFTIDVVSTHDFRMLGLVTTTPPEPLGRHIVGVCNEGTNCNNEWIMPQFGMGVPSELYMPGTLFAAYRPGRDAHTWSISISAGRPVLTR
jgi:hypothetical protein